MALTTAHLFTSGGSASPSNKLPDQFSYELYSASKRRSLIRTINGVVIQSSNPEYVAGDDVISWNIEAAYPTEYKALQDLYFTATSALYQFDGYWGDQYKVHFSVLEAPTARGRLFDLSGEFRIMQIVSLPTITSD